MYVLICSIEDQDYAFPLNEVRRAILAAEVTPLPNPPPFILGAINIQGQVIPVFNLRQRLNLPNRDLDINDHFLLCEIHQRQLVLWLDKVKKVRFCEQHELIPTQHIAANMEEIKSILKENGQLILIYDLEKLLTCHPLVSII